MARQPWAEVRRVLIANEIEKPEAKLARIKRFVELLIQWNRSVSNLISKNDEERIVAAHVLPSIEAVGWLKSHNLKSWCDLGSGGGFPAIPLILCGLGESWDLVESRRTKTLFLQRAKSELGLKQVRVFAARFEDLVADAGSAASASSEGESEEPSASVDAWGSSDPGAEVSGAGDELGFGAEDFEQEAQVPGAGDEFGTEADDSEVGDESGATGDLATGRWEVADHPRLAAPYDGFTSRATLSLAPTLEISASVVRPEGVAFLWKGSKLAEEAAASNEWRAHWEQSDAKVLSIEHSVVASFKRNSEK